MNTNVVVKTENRNYTFNFVDFERIQSKDIFSEFVEWCSVPKSLREPKTQIEFARTYNLSIDTLTDWKKRCGFEREVEYRSKQFFRQYTTEISYALVKKALTGNVSAVRLYMQLFEGFRG